jgi:hypothetical protein
VSTNWNYELRQKSDKEQDGLWIEKVCEHTLPEHFPVARWTDAFESNVISVPDHPYTEMDQINCANVLHHQESRG